MTNSYIQAKAQRDSLEAGLKAASDRFHLIPGIGTSPMGLTPDSVKFSEPYRLAKANVDWQFAALRRFNAVFCRQFAIEIRQDRDAQRLASLHSR